MIKKIVSGPVQKIHLDDMTSKLAQLLKEGFEVIEKRDPKLAEAQFASEAFSSVAAQVAQGKLLPPVTLSWADGKIVLTAGMVLNEPAQSITFDLSKAAE
jgi:hypothetical protein